METKEIRIACPTTDDIREVLFNPIVKETYTGASKKLHFERFVAGLTIKHAEELAYLMRESDSMLLLKSEENNALKKEVERLKSMCGEMVNIKNDAYQARLETNSLKAQLLESRKCVKKHEDTIQRLENTIMKMEVSVSKENPKRKYRKRKETREATKAEQVQA